MVASRHTCCMCNVPRQPVEKHHINEDPADNAWNNLAVLCRNCHGLVTQKGNLGARYTPGEVLRLKLRWEERCAEGGPDERGFLDELRETKVIEGGEHEEYPFDMKRGQELVFSIDANDALDLVICHEEDVDSWTGIDDDEEDDEEDREDDGEDDGDDDRPLPDGYWHKAGVIECRQ